MPSRLTLNLTTAKKKKPWWKTLFLKIQTKLHNHRNDVVKPPHSFSLKPRFRRKKKPRRWPVYVDMLFFEDPPPLAVVVGGGAGTEKRLTKAALIVDDDHGVDRTAVESGTMSSSGNEGGATGDDVWESMGFASPVMHGIDARAEEFISKFRADLEVQQMLARGL